MELPNLNCSNCKDLWDRAKKKPACWYNKCELEGLIDDIQLNSVIDCYLGAMRIADRGFIEQAQKLLEKSGLTQEPYLLVELDLIYSSALATRSKREAESDKGKKLANIKRRR